MPEDLEDLSQEGPEGKTEAWLDKVFVSQEVQVCNVLWGQLGTG